MRTIGAIRTRINAAGHWYGRQINAHPIAALTVLGAIAAVCFFLLAVAISLAMGEQPVTWWRHARNSVMQLLVWVGVALVVRSQLRKRG
ncbi:hypothetical protein [Nonomuraea rubra]|uniref:Membrane protein required for beta-lactamase induction n=1 Tax=Nonomuraea rubra TaxID=46180 RepID=A0A7X0P621_9ACTN|nr:hypothetical protein [Nonomuraea rubra]MBB6555939.1 membrane protein required for beta-lactamase induction [Nonomuraea rubra]